MNQRPGAPAVHYRFAQGIVSIYVDEVLRLQAPWPGPIPAYPETDGTIKQWAQCLEADDCDDMAALAEAAARLVEQGFRQDSDHVWRR